MYATQQYIEALTVGLSSQTGATIRAGDEWKVDIKNKILTYDLRHLTSLPFGVVRGLLLHEIGHLIYTGIVADSPAVQKYGAKLMMELYNPMEDIRIEERMRRKYGEYARLPIDDMNYWGIKNHIYNNNKDFTKLPRITQFSLLCLFGEAARRDCYVSQMVGGNAYHAKSNQYGFMFDIKVVKKFLDECHGGHGRFITDFLNQCRFLGDSAQLQEVIDKDLLPKVKDLLDEDKKDPKDQPKPQQSQGQPQQGQGQGQPQQKDDKDKDKKDGKGKGGGKNKDDKDDDKDGKGSSGGQGKDKDDKKDDSQGQPQSGGQDGSKKVGASLSEASKGDKFGMQKNDNPRPIEARPAEAEATALMYPYAMTLAQRLRDILKEQSATRWRGQHKSGKLLGKNAYKVCIKDETRVFSKKTTADTPKYDVYMAIDSSGSMAGPKSVHAFMAACLLKKTCQVLGFELNLYRFDLDCTKMNTLDDYKATGGGTEDTEAFREIEHDMKSNTASVVFIVTDGETGRNDDYEDIIKKIKSKGGEIYGIGIGESIRKETIEANYENPVVVQKSENLPKEIISIMRRIIKR